MTTTPEPRILSGPEAIAAGVRELASGGLVAFPTETVYGLGADTFDADAVAKVFAFKGRPAGNPLIVHVSGVEMARRVVARWTDDADTLARAFWPGPLTLVLPRSTELPEAVTAGGATVGVRCPDHPIALALIEASGLALVGPSANPSGRVSPTTADHVAAGFAGTDLLVIDGGPCRAGIESTVLELTGKPARILRPGVIGAPALARALGAEVLAHASDISPGEAAASPGLLGPHYQPRARTLLIPNGYVDQAAALAMRRPAALLWCHDSGFVWADAPRISIRMPLNAAEYARRLYAALMEADREGLGLILVEEPPRCDAEDFLDPAGPSRAIWDAVHERLGRAAERWQPRSPFTGKPLPD